MEKMIIATGAFELQRSQSFRGNDNEITVRRECWTCVYLICHRHLHVFEKVCDSITSLVSHCFRLFVFTLSYIPTRLFTNRNHGNMSLLICSPDSICHHQSTTASSLHLEGKRDGNERRRVWQSGFQRKTLHQSDGANCVITNSTATGSDGMPMIRSS